MESENDSADANKTAGSPVLGSSTYKRKFLKTKCSRKKTKIRLSDRFRDEILVSDESAGSVKNRNSSCDYMSGNATGLNENELVIAKCLPNQNVLSFTEERKDVRFQTASGKPLVSNKESSDFAVKLMGEIINPLAVSLRENKYSFLSKNSTKGNLKSDSKKCESILNFPGFEDEKYKYALKKYENIHNIIKAIFSGVSTNTINMQCPTDIVETDKLELCINDSLYSDNKKINHTEKMDNLNKNILAEVSVPIEASNSVCEKIKKEQNIPQFVTGSGKKINICPSSVSRIKTIFQDISDTNNFENVISQTNTVTNADNLNREISNNQNREMVNNVEIPQFSTASGKKIEISSNKLSKVHSIFKDITDFSNDFALNSNISGIYNGGSEICSGQARQINKNNSVDHSLSDLPKKLDKITVDTTLLRKNNKFKNCKKLDQRQVGADNFLKKSTPTTEKFTGKTTSLFSTASGKTIELPSSNLSQINKIFKDIPEFNYIQTNSNETHTKEISSLFSTASGKSIQFPSSSLAGIDNIFKNIPNFCDLKANNEGFSPLKLYENFGDISHTKISNITENNYIPLKNSFNVTVKEIDKIPCEFEGKIEQVTNDESRDNLNYVTPQRSLPKKRRLGNSLSKNGKISEVAMNRAKSLFGDINFDDLKLPSHLKFGSPSLTEIPFTPKRPNLISTPQYSSTPIRTINKNESFLNDVPQGINQRFLIQKPKTTNLKDLEEELIRQQNILEKKLEFVMKKQEAIRKQINGECSNTRFKSEPQAKKNKINLKDVKNLELQSDCMVPTNSIILQINPQNAALIHFNNNWHEVPTVETEDGCTLVPNLQGLIGISEIEPAFSGMSGIEKNLIPEGWIKNHYRWIVWKLASYERFFPATLGGCFTIDNVIKQLRYRYFRELYNAERPALRKIYEKDDISQKKMILCISNIIKNGDNTELELTDGWYSIRTIVDDPLSHQINNKKIKIGTKLIISGAELLNCEGCHPLELEQAQKVRLKINFNSTRRAAWFSKLGYQRDPSPLLIKLSNAVWNGGNIGRVTVYVARTYPVIYREKTEATVFWRNQNAEYKKIQEHENECFRKYEDGNVNMVRRNVCPLLQMTVIDVSDHNPKPFKCTIWESTDSHQEQLKENRVITCYNLTLRCNGELSCNKKSYFQDSKHDTVKYGKYRRKHVELASYQIMLENAIFGEFDTTGFIVKMHIEQNSQYFWLTDLKNNFLLVKINEGPSQCLLLNKVEEEYLVAVCNLTLNSTNRAYVIATGGFQTIVTQYPQYDFLRIKMEELENKNREEVQSRLKESRKIIDNFENGNKAHLSSNSSAEGNTMNLSRVTSTDAVMSMINIDEIVSKHTM